MAGSPGQPRCVQSHRKRIATPATRSRPARPAGEVADSVSVESPVPAALPSIEPYGSQGGLIWKESSPGQEIIVEFGKSPSEAASLRAVVIKLFGQAAGGAAAMTKGNAVFYTNHFKLTSQEISTVEGCLH